MAHRIEIALKDGVRDARGERVAGEIAHFLHLPVEAVRTIDVFTVDASLSRDELEQAAAGPFCDPVIQQWSIDTPWYTPRSPSASRDFPTDASAATVAP